MEPQRCPRREELAGYAAGTLHSEIADTIADHVDSCAQCDDTLAVLESSQAAVFPHLRQPPPEDSYAVEQQCARAVALVEQIGRDPSFSTQQKIDDGAAAADYPELIGAYQLLEKLGEGGMGAVYKAVHTKLRKVVALKLLPQRRTSDPQSIARFEREMRAVGALDHPLIVRAMDAGEADGVHYLVMEYIDGVDLSRLVREIGPLPWRQAVECVLQAARALAYAHGQGVVHRDIKPSNLVLEKSGGIKVLDMGLARMEAALEGDEMTAEMDLTASGQMMGTYDYMAPEQAFDTRSADARSDIYSLGCTLYRLVTGEAVYQGDTPLQKLLAHREAPIPSLRAFQADVPDQLEATFARMLAKEPDDRQQSMNEVIGELEAVLGLYEVGGATSSGGLSALYAQRHQGGVASNAQRRTSADNTIDRKTTDGTATEMRRNSASIATDTETVRRKRMLVGAVVFVAASASAVLIWLNSGKSVSPKKANAVSTHGKSVDAADGNSPPSAPGRDVANEKQTLTPADGWVDVLPLVDPAADSPSIAGFEDAGRFEQGDLVLGPRSLCGVPISLKGNYSLRAEFTSWDPKYLFLYFPIAQNLPTLVLEDNDNELGYLGAGLQAVDTFQVRHPENPTVIKDHLLIAGQKQVLDLTVASTGDQITIKAVLDGKPFVDWTGAGSRLDLLPQGADRRIEIRVYKGILRIHSLQLKMSDGEASLLRPGVAPSGPAITPADGPIDMIALFDLQADNGAIMKGADPGSWRIDQGDLVNVERDNALWWPLAVAGEYRIRAEFTRIGNPDRFEWVLPVAQRQPVLQLRNISTDTRKYIGGILYVDGRKVYDNGTGVVVDPTIPGKRQTLEIIVRTQEDEVTIQAQIDEQPFVDWTGQAERLVPYPPLVTDKPTQPALCIRKGEIRLHRIEFEMLSGEARLLRPLDFER